jgi:hypothetical protein
MEHEMQDASLHPDSSLLRTYSGDVAVVELKPWRRHRPSGFIRATNLLASQTTVSFADTTLLKWNTWTATITLTVNFLGLKSVQTTKCNNKVAYTARDISDCNPVEDSSIDVFQDRRRTQSDKCLTKPHDEWRHIATGRARAVCSPYLTDPPLAADICS